jgi:hypothetical protein
MAEVNQRQTVDNERKAPNSAGPGANVLQGAEQVSRGTFASASLRWAITGRNECGATDSSTKERWSESGW